MKKFSWAVLAVAILFHLIATILTVLFVDGFEFIELNPFMGFFLAFSPLLIFLPVFGGYLFLGFWEKWLDERHFIYGAVAANTVLTIWSFDLCWDLLQIFGGGA